MGKLLILTCGQIALLLVNVICEDFANVDFAMSAINIKVLRSVNLFKQSSVFTGAMECGCGSC
jgi:hypothetical protein